MLLCCPLVVRTVLWCIYRSVSVTKTKIHPFSEYSKIIQNIGFIYYLIKMMKLHSITKIYSYNALKIWPRFTELNIFIYKAWMKSSHWGLMNLLWRNTRGTHSPSFLFTVSLKTYSFTRVWKPTCWNMLAKYSERETQSLLYPWFRDYTKKMRLMKRLTWSNLWRRNMNECHPVSHRNSPQACSLI